MKEVEDEENRFLYGSHYSSAATVVFYLGTSSLSLSLSLFFCSSSFFFWFCISGFLASCGDFFFLYSSSPFLLLFLNIFFLVSVLLLFSSHSHAYLPSLSVSPLSFTPSLPLSLFVSLSPALCLLSPSSLSLYVSLSLVRMEPFTSLAIDLHDGKFDRPDRMFHSVF